VIYSLRVGKDAIFVVVERTQGYATDLICRWTGWKRIRRNERHTEGRGEVTGLEEATDAPGTRICLCDATEKTPDQRHRKYRSGLEAERIRAIITPGRNGTQPSIIRDEMAGASSNGVFERDDAGRPSQGLSKVRRTPTGLVRWLSLNEHTKSAPKRLRRSSVRTSLATVVIVTVPVHVTKQHGE